MKIKSVFFLLIILLISSALLNAQELTAVVKDSISQKVIPFASIYVNSGSGVVSNEEGHFRLQYDASKEKDSLFISCMGYKTLNIPLVNEQSIPESLKTNPKISCVVGLTTEPQRLVDIRKNRMNALKEKENTNYTNISKIEKEINEAKKTFNKYKWPTIDVTRKSVEETAASIIKIYEINKKNG